LQNHLKYENIDRDFINVGNLTDVDWQNLGKVSEIKNQGNCNAGYAFSTTSLIETSLMMENQDILLS
jgi:C1A family cysteine protease